MKKPRRSYSRPISLIISLVLLAVLLRWVDPGEFGSMLTGVDVRWLGAYLFLVIAGLILRAERYRLLLEEDPGLGGLFWVTAIRNMFVDLLPARTGAVSYIYVLKKKYRVPVAAGTSTLLVSMILDYIVFAPILVVSAALSAEDVGLSLGYLTIASLVFLVLTLILVFGLGSASRWVARILERLSADGGRSEWLARLGQGTRDLEMDIGRIRGNRGRYGSLVAISFVIRGGKYAALYFLLVAVLGGRGYSPGSLVFTHVLLGAAAAEMSTMLPLHSPGGLGSWDMAWTLAFAAMGYSLEEAATAGLAVHLISKVVEYLLGCSGILLLFGRRPR